MLYAFGDVVGMITHTLMLPGEERFDTLRSPYPLGESWGGGGGGGGGREYRLITKFHHFVTNST